MIVVISDTIYILNMRDIPIVVPVDVVDVVVVIDLIDLVELVVVSKNRCHSTRGIIDKISADPDG